MTGPASSRGTPGEVRETATSAASIDRLVEVIRELLPDRPTAADLPALAAAGALIVDIRPTEQGSRAGELPGAVVVDRNLLEWRLDPSSPCRIPEATGAEQTIVIVCNEGYASTLAAETLQRIGLPGATDLAGGFQAVISLAESAGG